MKKLSHIFKRTVLLVRYGLGYPKRLIQRCKRRIEITAIEQELDKWLARDLLAEEFEQLEARIQRRRERELRRAIQKAEREALIIARMIRETRNDFRYTQKTKKASAKYSNYLPLMNTEYKSGYNAWKHKRWH